MSDKNRNMNDINDQQTAEQQAFSEEIRRRLAEPGSGKPTLEEFKLLVYKDREKRRKTRNALVACIVAAFIVGYLTYDDLVPEVGADKNPKETIQTEDGVIIEDGGWGSSEEEDNVWVIDNWKQVADAKQHYPTVLVPKYIPEGYRFYNLTIKGIVEEDLVYKYSFVDTEGQLLEIEIVNFLNGETSVKIKNYNEIMHSSKGEIYIQGNGSAKKATISLDKGGVVYVIGDISKEAIIKIIEKLDP